MSKAFNFPVPRYTSYPTVPYWDKERFSLGGYQKSLQSVFWESAKEVSLYIHLPFCESLCTYCACNTRITKNHSVELPYLTHVLKEWDLYLSMLPEMPVVKEIHLGGGTPTFFSASNLEKLVSGIIMKSKLAEDFHMSFEGHPGNTSYGHLKTLSDVGFDRMSLGIQDFEPLVQKLINRNQSYDDVRRVVEQARSLGYSSINFDLVYGLPAQNRKTIEKTLLGVGTLKPERVAYYGYAHVPTLKPGQKRYEAYLPSNEARETFKEIGRTFFLVSGYEEVGMDHFALPGDELLEAKEGGELHRNFMGYTPFSTRFLIGLGASAISDSWTAFAQNEKKVEDYYTALDQEKLPIKTGHLLNEEDLFFRKHILELICKFETSWSEQELLHLGTKINFELLDRMQEEGLLTYSGEHIQVHEFGKKWIRVICSALDARMNDSREASQFSTAV